MTEHLIEVPALLLGKGMGPLGISWDNLPADTWIGRQALTLEVWFRPDGIEEAESDTNPFLQLLSTDSVPLMNLGINLLKNEPYMEYVKWRRYPNGTEESKRILDGRWSHFAVVLHQGSDAEWYYCNLGDLQNPPAAQRYGEPGNQAFNLQPSRIILSPMSESGFRGAFGELRLWNIPRTKAEIDRDRGRRLVGNEPGLVCYWPLDDGEGEDLLDQTVNANDGTFRGAQWDDYAGLTLSLGDVAGRVAFLTDSLATCNENSKALQQQATELEQALANKQAELMEQRANASARRDELAHQEREARDMLTQARLEDEQHRAQVIAEKKASGRLSWGGLITQIEQDVGDAISAGNEEGPGYRLENVSVDLKVVPGIGGEGLHLPDIDKAVDPQRLSTLTVRLKRRPAETKEAPSVKVPELRDYTESFARRKLSEAGLRAEVIYQSVDVDRQESVGRVIDQRPGAGGEPVKPNSPIQIFVGTAPGSL